MPFQKGHPKVPGSGRQKGTQNKAARVEGYARAMVEDPDVREQILAQARQGTLPAPVLTMLFHYAYGKPAESRPDDDAFVQELLTVAGKHVTSAEGRREIRQVIEGHASLPALRLVR
jgi:hypothetical protein